MRTTLTLDDDRAITHDMLAFAEWEDWK